MPMDIHVGDVLTMKKAHPCGEKRWQVLRVGADFKLRCLGCGHEVMGPRSKFEKNIRSIFSEANWGTYGYGDCGSPVSKVPTKP